MDVYARWKIRTEMKFDARTGVTCHYCSGALYADEGSTNWNITRNVIQRAPVWLQGCRPGCAWIGPLWQDYNWFDAASALSINVESRCPLIGDVLVNGSAWPADAVAVMRQAGPRPVQ